MGDSLLINGVYWGYNPLTNLLLTSCDIQVVFPWFFPRIPRIWSSPFGPAWLPSRNVCGATERWIPRWRRSQGWTSSGGALAAGRRWKLRKPRKVHQKNQQESRRSKMGRWKIIFFFEEIYHHFVSWVVVIFLELSMLVFLGIYFEKGFFSDDFQWGFDLSAWLSVYYREEFFRALRRHKGIKMRKTIFLLQKCILTEWWSECTGMIACVFFGQIFR